jgi:putative transposase
MNDRRYRRHTRSVCSLKYQLVWCPIFLCKVLVEEMVDELRSLPYQKAQELETVIETLKIMPDHVHLFIQSDPIDAPERLAKPFKGYSSRMLRQKHPQLCSHFPSKWSRSYYMGLIGKISEGIIRQNIEMQRSR